MPIRKALKEDAAQIKILVESLSHFYLLDRTNLLPEWFTNTITISEFKRRIENNYFTHLVYEDAGEILGYIAMRGEQHLYHLFVAEDAQGNGIARQLWQELMQLLPSKTYSLRSSLYAIPVYKTFGFIETGPSGEKEGIAFQEMTFNKIQ